VIGVVYTVVAHFHLGHFLPYVVSRIVGIYPEYGQWRGRQLVDSVVEFPEAAQGVGNQFSSTAKWGIRHYQQLFWTEFGNEEYFYNGDSFIFGLLTYLVPPRNCSKGLRL